MGAKPGYNGTSRVRAKGRFTSSESCFDCCLLHRIPRPTLTPMPPLNARYATVHTYQTC